MAIETGVAVVVWVVCARPVAGGHTQIKAATNPQRESMRES